MRKDSTPPSTNKRADAGQGAGPRKDSVASAMGEVWSPYPNSESRFCTATNSMINNSDRTTRFAFSSVDPPLTSVQVRSPKVLSICKVIPWATLIDTAPWRILSTSKLTEISIAASAGHGDTAKILPLKKVTFSNLTPFGISKFKPRPCLDQSHPW